MHHVLEKFTVYQTLTNSANIIPCYYFGICYTEYVTHYLIVYQALKNKFRLEALNYE